MDILREKLGPGVKNIERPDGRSDASVHQRVHHDADAQADAPARWSSSDGRCMEWVVWREYHELLTGIARDPDFSDFSLQLHSVAIEGLVIFGI